MKYKFDIDKDPEMRAIAAAIDRTTPTLIAQMQADWEAAIKELIPRFGDLNPRIYRKKPTSYLSADWKNRSKSDNYDEALLLITHQCKHRHGYQFPLWTPSKKNAIANIEKRDCPACSIERWIAGMLRKKKFWFCGEPDVEERVAEIREKMLSQSYEN